MKRYSKLFNLDLTRQTKNAWCAVRTIARIDPTFVVLSIGKLQPDGLQEKIDSFPISKTQKNGVNLYPFDRIPNSLNDFLMIPKIRQKNR